MDNDRQLVSHLLGQAVIDVWGGLPQDIQQKLFEQAILVGPGNEEKSARAAGQVPARPSSADGRRHEMMRAGASAQRLQPARRLMGGRPVCGGVQASARCVVNSRAARLRLLTACVCRLSQAWQT